MAMDIAVSAVNMNWNVGPFDSYISDMCVIKEESILFSFKGMTKSWVILLWSPCEICLHEVSENTQYIFWSFNVVDTYTEVTQKHCRSCIALAFYFLFDMCTIL